MRNRFNHDNTQVITFHSDEDNVYAIIHAPDMTQFIGGLSDDERLTSYYYVRVRPACDVVEMTCEVENVSNCVVRATPLIISMNEGCFIQRMIEDEIIHNRFLT